MERETVDSTTMARAAVEPVRSPRPEPSLILLSRCVDQFHWSWQLVALNSGQMQVHEQRLRLDFAKEIEVNLKCLACIAPSLNPRWGTASTGHGRIVGRGAVLCHLDRVGMPGCVSGCHGHELLEGSPLPTFVCF